MYEFFFIYYKFPLSILNKCKKKYITQIIWWTLIMFNNVFYELNVILRRPCEGCVWHAADDWCTTVQQDGNNEQISEEGAIFGELRRLCDDKQLQQILQGRNFGP